jgi:hypothetical protein
MNKEIINWLLEGPSWIKYAVELQFLDLKPEVQPVLHDESIAKIVGRLKDAGVGIPALGTWAVSCEQSGNAYWDLFFLADIGLTGKDLQLEHEIERVFQLQSPDGTFMTEIAMQPDYFCVSAILLSSIAKIDYKADPRLAKYLRVILNSQYPDGGWHCARSHNDRLACPMDNLNVLMLLGQYGEYRTDSRFNGAVDFLLDHWQRRGEKLRLDGFGVGRRFRSLEYPATMYGILRVLDVLSLFPYAIASGIFQSMVDFVRQKSVNGKYFAEAITPAYSGFDFGQKQEPSRWITFLVNRIEKRISEQG